MRPHCLATVSAILICLPSAAADPSAHFSDPAGDVLAYPFFLGLDSGTTVPEGRYAYVDLVAATSWIEDGLLKVRIQLHDLSELALVEATPVSTTVYWFCFAGPDGSYCLRAEHRTVATGAWRFQLDHPTMLWPDIEGLVDRRANTVEMAAPVGLLPIDELTDPSAAAWSGWSKAIHVYDRADAGPNKDGA